MKLHSTSSRRVAPKVPPGLLAGHLQRLEASIAVGDNDVRIGTPDEGLRLDLIVLGDEAVDCRLQIDDRVKDAGLRRRRVSLAKKPSTAFNHELNVGVK